MYVEGGIPAVRFPRCVTWSCVLNLLQLWVFTETELMVIG